MFDTDFAIQKIIADAGIPEQQARSFVRMVVDAQLELATKRDLQDLERNLKKEIDVFRIEMSLIEKTLSLKIMGLYAFIAIVASGVAKLVFLP
jgi:hypothetical protein